MSAVLKPRRERRCKVCSEWFRPFNTIQPVCATPKCALEWARRLKAKKLRLEKREGRERLKSRRDHERDAQRAFNAYIRERDRFEPCICCGLWPKTPSNHQFDAGHYRTAAAAPQLRFDEDNCHKQLVSCNRGKSGNAVEYRKRLVLKIGLARVEALENNNAVAKRDIAELKAIRKAYQVKLRDLKARREMWGVVA